MRLRLAVPASLVAALVVAALPSAVLAAPKHNHGLTINATPRSIVAGDAVLIYGQLNLAHPGNRLIVLYHRVDAKHFTVVQSTRTDAAGFYEFTRAEDVVLTNRSWYVRGPNNTHSRTIKELVAGAVSLAASSASVDTNHSVTFTGHVSPNNAGRRVILQVQQGLKGDDWRTVASDTLGPDSNYTIKHKFLQPGERDLRVLFVGDRRDGDNVSAVSDTVTVSVQQTQVPSFTINASAPNIDEGSSVTISGVLSMKGTTKPDPGQLVQLYGHAADTAVFTPIGTPSTTDKNGGYTFTATPTKNEVYQVRTVASTAATPQRRTARLFEGVRDVVTLTSPANNSSATVGQTVTFSGKVTPNKAGHVIDLQRMGSDGDWHTVKTSRVASDSTYSISWTFGSAGTKQFRTLVPGGEINTSGHSTPVVITVSLPPVQTLPPAS